LHSSGSTLCLGFEISALIWSYMVFHIATKVWKWKDTKQLRIVISQLHVLKFNVNLTTNHSTFFFKSTCSCMWQEKVFYPIQITGQYVHTKVMLFCYTGFHAVVHIAVCVSRSCTVWYRIRRKVKLFWNVKLFWR